MIMYRYYVRAEAGNAISYIGGTKLDDRIIRIDWDAGFVDGRQFGRGKSGGQVSQEGRNMAMVGHRGLSDSGRERLVWDKRWQQLTSLL